ncbi:hypothetical protein D6764_02365 [Candidatus Woesearchaeota archaeon]|nr:MAG: hypothetical protein D6764_02365 [Candidatus Woesearchaeota archaeon]
MAKAACLEKPAGAPARRDIRKSAETTLVKSSGRNAGIATGEKEESALFCGTGLASKGETEPQ